MSTAIAALFGSHARGYQSLSVQMSTWHDEFVQALSSGANAYAAAEAANASPLQAVLAAVNAPVVALASRPLIGNGTNAHRGQRGRRR